MIRAAMELLAVAVLAVAVAVLAVLEVVVLAVRAPAALAVGAAAPTLAVRALPELVQLLVTVTAFEKAEMLRLKRRTVYARCVPQQPSVLIDLLYGVPHVRRAPTPRRTLLQAYPHPLVPASAALLLLLVPKWDAKGATTAPIPARHRLRLLLLRLLLRLWHLAQRRLVQWEKDERLEVGGRLEAGVSRAVDVELPLAAEEPRAVEVELVLAAWLGVGWSRILGVWLAVGMWLAVRAQPRQAVEARRGATCQRASGSPLMLAGWRWDIEMRGAHGREWRWLSADRWFFACVSWA